MRVGAGARQPQQRPQRQPPQLQGGHRRVGRADGDARALRRRRRPRPGRTAARRPSAARGRRSCTSAARPACARRSSATRCRCRRRSRSTSCRCRCRRCPRPRPRPSAARAALHVLDGDGARVAQVGVVALPHHRDQRVRRVARPRPGPRRGRRCPRRGCRTGRSPSGRSPTRRSRASWSARRRRSRSPRRPAPAAAAARPPSRRSARRCPPGVADQHARHVGDRVARPGRKQADRAGEVAPAVRVIQAVDPRSRSSYDHGCSCSNARAARSTRASAPRRPTICRPTGSPSTHPARHGGGRLAGDVERVGEGRPGQVLRGPPGHLAGVVPAGRERRSPAASASAAGRRRP